MGRGRHASGEATGIARRRLPRLAVVIGLALAVVTSAAIAQAMAPEGPLPPKKAIAGSTSPGPQRYLWLEVQVRSTGPVSRPSSTLAVVRRETRTGVLARHRSNLTVPGELLVIGSDERGSPTWRTTVIDPRIMRAESADADGTIAGTTVLRPSTDLYLAVPDDPSITELTVYQPDGSGTSATMARVGAVSLQ